MEEKLLQVAVHIQSAEFSAYPATTERCGSIEYSEKITHPLVWDPELVRIQGVARVHPLTQQFSESGLTAPWTGAERWGCRVEAEVWAPTEELLACIRGEAREECLKLLV